jgi:acyl-CoA synthetase (AMP-forming)/AMP-acid ligase II
MSEQRSDAGAGWVSFAGIILITVGIFQAFAGLVGLIEDEFYAVTPEYVVQFDATTWGWIHIIIGLIVVAAGFGIFSGNVLARTVGVFAALGSMISVFAWLPWYPIWGIIVVSMNIAIIWALTDHGRVLADR